MKNTICLIFIILTINSCKQRSVEGIIIGSTLFQNQSYFKNYELRQIIRQTLKKDEKALAKLNSFWCGGGSGCYDLGFIITQIIYQIGEKEFVIMIKRLNFEETNSLKTLILAGLEYGDGMDYKNIENEFPEIMKILNSRN